MPQLEEALRNEKEHQRYVSMNAELHARLKELHATNKEAVAGWREANGQSDRLAERVKIQEQQLQTEAGFRRELEAENKRLRAMVDKRNGSRKSGGKVGRPCKHPAPLTAEENSDPQKQAADAMEVESS